MLVVQSCLILCDPMDCSLPGSSVHGILQAGILKWFTRLSSRGLPHAGIKPASPASTVGFVITEPPWKPISCVLGSNKVKVKSLSCVQFFATPWTVDYQAPQPMEFSRQEYWSVLPFLSPGDLPNPGIKPRSPALKADAFYCTEVGL